MYLYFSTGNGQPREPALCQLYRHTFVPYTRSNKRRRTECLATVSNLLPNADELSWPRTVGTATTKEIDERVNESEQRSNSNARVHSWSSIHSSVVIDDPASVRQLALALLRHE